jgi:hypothetical protein
MNIQSNPIGWMIAGIIVLIIVSYFIYLVPRLISAALYRSKIEAEKRKEQDHG